MNTYRIADTTVKMECWGETLRKQAKRYQIDSLDLQHNPDIIIDIDVETFFPRVKADESTVSFS